jgi:hypothetical protein
MTTRSKLLFTALVAIFTMAFAVGTASALRSIEIGGRREISYTSRALTFEGEGTNVICEVTLNATLNAAISKTERSQAGTAEARANEAACSGGHARPLNVRGGWRVLYKSFTGTLPSITSVRLILEGTAFLVEAFGGLGRCLYSGNSEGTTGPNTSVTEIRADETVKLNLFRNDGISCPARGGFKGTFTGATITLRLV